MKTFDDLSLKKPIWIANIEPISGSQSPSTQSVEVLNDGTILSNVQGTANRLPAHLWGCILYLVELLKISINDDGTLKPSAVVGSLNENLGLENDDISDTAAIDELKLKLNFVTTARIGEDRGFYESTTDLVADLNYLLDIIISLKSEIDTSVNGNISDLRNEMTAADSSLVESLNGLILSLNLDNIIEGEVNTHLTFNAQSLYDEAYEHSQLTTGNIHKVTKTDVGLANVPNLDFSDPANITPDSTHRWMTDTEKSNITDHLNKSSWQNLIPITDFNTTAQSTSTIGMNTNQISNIEVGSALRYKLLGVYYYGRVSSLTASLLTIEGVVLNTGVGVLTELAFLNSGNNQLAMIGPFMFAGDDLYNEVGKRYFAKSSTTTLIASRFPMQGGFRFRLTGRWRLIAVEIITTQNDSTAVTQPTIQITNNGNNCLTTPIIVPNNTMVTTNITIDPTYSLFVMNDILEMSLISASGGTPSHNSANLTCNFFFVKV